MKLQFIVMTSQCYYNYMPFKKKLAEICKYCCFFIRICINNPKTVSPLQNNLIILHINVLIIYEAVSYRKHDKKVPKNCPKPPPPKKRIDIIQAFFCPFLKNFQKPLCSQLSWAQIVRSTINSQCKSLYKHWIFNFLLYFKRKRAINAPSPL